jgi:hypothetical protein
MGNSKLKNGIPPSAVRVGPAFVLSLFLLSACNRLEEPLDAKTRDTIDSISNAQIQRLERELDSLCRADQPRKLPHLVDSLLIVRKKEIEQLLLEK